MLVEYKINYLYIFSTVLWLNFRYFYYLKHSDNSPRSNFVFGVDLLLFKTTLVAVAGSLELEDINILI